MKRVVMISTGGTIASERNPETGLLSAGLMTGEKLAVQCDLPDNLEVDVQSFLQIPSNHMTFNGLVVLKEKIDKTFEDGNVAGIVVTHGTDMLEETAYFLDLTIADERPVVVTGSQRGPTVMGTDAFVNLRQAIMLAAHEEARGMGTIVLFNERIFSARYVEKVHASNVAGFTSYGVGYLGIVDQDHIHIYQRPVKRDYFMLQTELPEIEIVSCGLGSSGRFIRHAADVGLAGVIIEAPGRGHAPPHIMDSVRYAIGKDLHLILTTHADEGEVKVVYDFPGSAYDLENTGVVLGRDYSSKKARIRLAVLLAAGQTDIDKFF